MDVPGASPKLFAGYANYLAGDSTKSPRDAYNLRVCGTRQKSVSLIVILLWY